MSDNKTIELTEEEKHALTEIMREDFNIFLDGAKRISIIAQATEGKNIDQSGVSDYLIDLNDVKERSRYPTYAILSLVVYLNNIASFNPNARSCKEWADTLSKALISYKGLGRIESLETKKAIQGNAPNQEFYLSSNKYDTETKPVKQAHFWSKAPKQGEEAEEFNE